MSVFPGSFTGKQYPLSPVKFKPFSQSQKPRFVVVIDGHAYIGSSFRYSQNAHGATDTAEVVLPIDGASNMPKSPNFNGVYPDWTRSIERTDTLGNADRPVTCQIYSGEPTDPSTFSATNRSGLVLRFTGVVDMYSVQLRENKTTFTCRSLAFPLTSRKITTPFPRENSTTTIAFIAQQAQRFGLQFTSNLLNAPMLMIDVLGGEFQTGVRGWFIWDLMVRCAQADDVDLWVDRMGTIHYEAASAIQRKPVYYIWGQNVKEIEGTHSPQFSKNIVVAVHSWTKRTRTVSGYRVSTDPTTGGVKESQYTRVVNTTPIFGTTSSLEYSVSPNGTVTVSEGSVSGGSAGSTTGSLSESGKEHYTYFLKNKTLAQCQQIAQNIWRQISMHEYAVKIEAPVTSGNLPVMDVDCAVMLSGHPMTYFNGEFWPREIIESFDPKTGWNWEIDCVNHEPPQGAV